MHFYWEKNYLWPETWTMGGLIDTRERLKVLNAHEG